MILSQVPILSPPPMSFAILKKKNCLYVQIFPLLITFISFILIVHYQPPLFSFHSIFCMLLLYSLNNLFLLFTFSVTAAHSSHSLPTAATVTSSIRFTHTTTTTASSQHSCLTCQDLATISRKQPKLNEKFYWCIMGNIQLIPESVMMQMASFIV